MERDRILTVEDLMGKGYINAVKSMLMFTQESLGFIQIKSEIHSSPMTISKPKNDGAVITLRTDLMGDIYGKSYFVMSEREASYLATHSLKKINGSLNLHEHFLKELDNILSAAVISKLSSALHVKMLGDVPHLEKWNTWNDFDDSLTRETKAIGKYYCNVIEISFDHHPELLPLFVWIFDIKFIDKAREMNYSIDHVQSIIL